MHKKYFPTWSTSAAIAKPNDSFQLSIIPYISQTKSAHGRCSNIGNLPQLIISRIKINANVLNPIRLKHEIMRQAMSHRIDKKIEARLASGFCHGYKVSVSSNENYLINKPLMRERGNIESYSHINARLLKANKRIVIFLKIGD